MALHNIAKGFFCHICSANGVIIHLSLVLNYSFRLIFQEAFTTDKIIFFPSTDSTSLDCWCYW